MDYRKELEHAENMLEKSKQVIELLGELYPTDILYPYEIQDTFVIITNKKITYENRIKYLKQIIEENPLLNTE